MTHPIKALLSLGQSIWLDNIHRDMLNNGELRELIVNEGLRGVTSNPTIFEKAITTSSSYDSIIGNILRDQANITDEQLFMDVAVRDIGEAADLFRDVYESSGGHDGMVSIEVSPRLANDTAGTIAEGKELHKRLNRPNIMIKVPATLEGLPAIEALISEGINVNVTLLFSIDRYKAVFDAYLKGLETRLQRGLPIDKIASVASFFVSRVDTLIDKQLESMGNDAIALAGQAAIANAKIAYTHMEKVIASDRFAKLAAAGAKPQRLLWASTSTKNPNYRDVMYVETLIGENTVNTLPPATFDAFRDHGIAKSTINDNQDRAASTLAALTQCGIDIAKVTHQLEEDGVASFKASFHNLLDALAQKRKHLA